MNIFDSHSVILSLFPTLTAIDLLMDGGNQRHG